MRVPFSILLATTALCLALAPIAQADADAAFAKANADFAAGNFPAAIAGYESLVKDRQWNASLFYNLGNAYFRAGDRGRAILNYERALALDPNQPETRANLQLVRDQARAFELTPDRVEEHLGFLTPTQYAWLGAAAFWGATAIFCGLYLAQRRPVVWIFALLLSGTVAVGAVFALYQFETGRAGRDLAIITSKNVQARLATAESAGTVLILPPGSEIKILSTRGDWLYTDLPNDLQGWIPARSAERVRL
jgi:tetratricopeptide (TPR) repeat protein